MRDRKYRAWDEKFQVMLPDVAVFDNNNIVVTDVTINFLYNGDALDQRLEDVEDAGPEHYCITGNIVIMEFIDREDCEGQDMYDGDILSSNGLLYVVEWDDRTCAFFAKSVTSGVKYTMNSTNIIGALIVGNIYENSELLEGCAK